jgi:hypothetical protein
VFHPIGIKSEKIVVYLKNSIYPGQFAYQFPISRTDSPTQNFLKNVTFSGSFQIPTSILPGVWNISTDVIQGLVPVRTMNLPESGPFIPANFREMPGAENSLLIRLNSELKFDFQTFVGPAFRSEISASDGKPIELSVEAPIWKIGETVDLSKYFQMRTRNVPLQVLSKTPSICSANGTILKLLSLGECNYRVFTASTNDYLYKELNLFSTITQARTKPELSIPKIENQVAIGLPKTISREPVYSYGSMVIPIAITPSICLPTSNGVTIFSGGSCVLEYKTEPSLTLLASEKYIQSFEILKTPQTISFSLPIEEMLSKKSIALSATTSSGGAVTFESTTRKTCIVNGMTLMFVKSGKCSITAIQLGSSIVEPISVNATMEIREPVTNKTITCALAGKTKKISGLKPKCPKGYSRVR